MPFFLRLRRPNVFDLIRENNLFTDVQDQVLLLVEFDHELMEKRRKEKAEASEPSDQEDHSEAIELLVDNVHSIPVSARSTILNGGRSYNFRLPESSSNYRRDLSISFCTSI